LSFKASQNSTSTKPDEVDQDEDYYDDEEDEYEDEPEFTTTSRKRKRSSAPANKPKSYKGVAAKLPKKVQAKAPPAGLSTHNFSSLEDVSTMRNHSKDLVLKPDHSKRPLWITEDNLIFVEKFSPVYQQAADFLVAIADPESRPEYIQTYRITDDSLYSAVAVSIDADSIIKVLNRLCKTDIPRAVIDYIKLTTAPFGKAKVVLKDNKYFIESKYPDVLKKLLQSSAIANARVAVLDGAMETAEGFLQDEGLLENAKNLDYAALARDRMDDEEENDDYSGTSDNMFNISQKRFQTVSFMIRDSSVQEVKKCAKSMGYPLMEEYDFKKDRRNPDLSIDLRPSTKIRPYQEKSLSKMFGNGRARSGIIVLPCGAGKSLTGVTAATTIKKSCVVMCINNASVRQWRDQFLLWTTVGESSVKMFTSDAKDPLPEDGKACIVISTYSMMCHSGPRSSSGEKMMKSIEEREWGLLLLDEVHVAPAEMFKKIVDKVRAHCKLGLTATLVREDNKIPELGFLVGPKLYEANWIDLTNQGYLAKVQCSEIWCPMTKEFYAEYINHSVPQGARVQRILYTLNPAKFRACEYLVNYHVSQNHKIIVFSDDVPALMLYCELLTIPAIYGGTKEDDRKDILHAFKTSTAVPCIGLSKVGDTALDIPEANVIIQVSSHFGARKQEAQRLGRILRPKPNPTGGYNAFFYTLVSTDTSDMFFSTKRQQYLVDQGYTFKVVQDLSPKADKVSRKLNSKKLEMELLEKILDRAQLNKMSKEDEEESKAIHKLEEGEFDGEEKTKRVAGSLSSKSKVGEGNYEEFF
jgi:DNA excision repair protein ERCC-3